MTKKTVLLIGIMVGIGLSLRAMDNASLARMPFQEFVVSLSKKGEMTPLLSLGLVEYGGVISDQEAVKAKQAQENKKEFISFNDYLDNHQWMLSDYRSSLIDGSTLYSSSVFLVRLNDMLKRYYSASVPEVEVITAQSDGSTEKLQKTTAAFMKWYWARQLADESLSRSLAEKALDAISEIDEALPLRAAMRGFVMESPLQVGNDDAVVAEVIRFHDALVWDRAVKDFQDFNKTYSGVSPQEPITEVDENGNTALHYVAYKGSESVFLMLNQETIDATINGKNSSGDLPLHIAIRQGHTDMAQKLLAMPTAHYEEENNNGETPLSLATKNYNYEIIAELLRMKGAKVVGNIWSSFTL